VALATLNLAVLLVGIDATVLNLAVPQITAALQPSGTQVLWVLDVYSLVLAGLLVTAGTLADRLGRKRVLLAGCVLFGLASLVSAYAPTTEALIAARVLLAVGGATIMPSTLALIRTIFPDPRERTLAVGTWSAMAAAGAAVGPIVGGVLLEQFWWGSVFLLNIPVMLLLLVAGSLTLPEFRDPSPGAFDVPGALTSIVGLVALVYAIKKLAEDGVTGLVVAAAAVAALAIAAFVRRQLSARHPLVDVTLFRRRSFTGAVLGTVVALLALSGLLLFVSQYLQLVLGAGPLEAGLRMLPLTVGAIVGAPLTARLTAAVGQRATMTAGLLAAAAGMLGFGLALEQPYPVLAAALALLGAGVGIALTCASDAVLSAAPPERAGAASSISETAYELGTGLGIAVLGSVLSALYVSGFVVPAAVAQATGPDGAGVADAARESLASAVAVAGQLPPAQAADLVAAAVGAFDSALRSTATASAALLTAAAALTAWLLAARRPRVGAAEG
jgi:DHA2 family multidrug resistance protein-like MFS transporter